jgi:uncharacterized protein
MSFNGYSEQSIHDALNPRIFHLILFPTEQCNFRCVYCYEDFEIGKMSDETVEGIKNLLSSRAKDLSSLHLSWFGGEPLLARKIVLDISKHAFELSQQYHFTLSGDVTTNGYLLNEAILKPLSQYQQAEFQISLDGTDTFHNKTRVLKNGDGTFHQIWARLLSMKKMDYPFKVKIRVHVNANNVDNITELTEKINVELGDDSRFSVYYKGIFNAGGKQLVKIKQLTSKNNNHEAEKHNLKHKTPLTEEKSKYFICYAAKPNSFQIRADGRIGKCTVALKDKKNDLGKITQKGILKIDQKKFRQWLIGFENFDQEALACPIHSLNKPKDFPSPIPFKSIEA